MKIVSIVGARPQFIKLAPLCKELGNHAELVHVIVHTGQHYDYNMSKVFFDELGIPDPNYHLDVGSQTHGRQTGEMLQRIEEVLLKEKPDWAIVYGDTNSTLAGALASAKLHVPIAHIEAGLRSYNMHMPEEINRVLTDHCSTILFCPTMNAVRNLEREGFSNIVNDGEAIDGSFKIHDSFRKKSLVINAGDIMYDSMLLCLEKAEKSSAILQSLQLEPKAYSLATVHRAENTDNAENLKNIMEALAEEGKSRPLVFPIHPRTKNKLKELQLFDSLSNRIRFIDPVSYFDVLILEKSAHKVFTDSGGMQKEAYFLKVPCITLRNETEWIETVESGWNVLAGADPSLIADCARKLPNNKKDELLFGNGSSSRYMVNILKEFSSGLVHKNGEVKEMATEGVRS